MAKKKRIAKKPKMAAEATSLPYESLIDNFTQDLESIFFIFPVLIKAIARDGSVFFKVFKRFADKKLLKTPDGGSGVRVEDLSKFEDLAEKRIHFERSLVTIPAALFVNLVTHLDAHFRDLLKLTLKSQPNVINNTEKNISIAELFELQDFDEAKRYVVEREISQILESRLKFFNWLDTRLNIKLNLEQTLTSKLVEITEKRNILVHADGLADKKYIDAYRSAGFEQVICPKIGDKVSIDAKYFSQSFRTLYLIGVRVGQVVWRKMAPEETREADRHLINMSASLIKRSRFKMAEELADFGTKLPAFSDEMRRTILINKALAVKFQKRQEDAIKLIDAEDWSSCHPKFKLAVSVLKDDLESAAKLMLILGKSFEMEHAYKDWPLFKEFRKTKLFTDTYRKIFGRSYISVSSKPKAKKVKSSR